MVLFGTIKRYLKHIELRVQKIDWSGSDADFAKIIELNPNDPAVYFYQASFRENRTGDMDGAIADYTKVVALKPDLAQVYLKRAAIKETANLDWDGAIGDYTRVIEMNPDYPMPTFFAAMKST